MKKYALLLFLSLMSLSTFAQLSVSYSAGYAMFDQKGLRDGLAEQLAILENRFGASGSVVKDFPNVMTHNVSVAYKMQQQEYGFQITYLGTKGEVEVSDNIFKYGEQPNLTALRFGTLFRYYFIQLPFLKEHKASVYGEISPALTVTSLKYKNALRFNVDDSDQIISTYIDDLSGGSVSFSVLPKIGLKVDVLKRLSIFAAIGYDLSVGGNIEKMNDASVNWSGARAECGLSFLLKK